MKTSARNRFEGTVAAIRDGAIDDEVIIAVAGDRPVVANVTRESRDRLGLTVGAAAFGRVKASSVILPTESDDVRLSVRNRLPGLVARFTRGIVNTQVVLREPTDVGPNPTAIFEASSVVIGVRAAR